MRFTVIYRNDQAVREQVIQLLLSVIHQGNDLEKVPINHPLCSVQRYWPDTRTLVNLPLNMQCEEIDFIDGSIRTNRLQVIDVESVAVMEEIPLDKSPSPA